MSNNKEAKVPFVWIVSGPSGSGKTSLCDALLKNPAWRKRLLRSVSCTTRLLRPGEKEGKDYAHLSEKKFLAWIKHGAFLEYEKIFGCYYGTPKKVFSDAQKAGKNLLLCIDVKGARTVRRFFKKNVASIFILTPHIESLGERLAHRSTENKKDIQKRLKRVKIELSFIKDYDYVIINDTFSDALKKLKSIMTIKEGERSKKS